ncbi:MAG: hypothetical protein ACYDAZ_08425, partial [Thermoplasmataceae archaeon]
MVLPIIQYADSHQQQSPVIYRYGNEYVQFSGQNAYVGFGDSIYPVSWAMYQINPASPIYTPFNSGNGSSPLMVQTFSHYRTTRIENAYQNSAVMIRWNHNIRIAEVFSFVNGGIDASVAFKNMNSGARTFLIAFSARTSHSENAQVVGLEPRSVHSPSGMGNQKFMISSMDWGVSTSNISVSWRNQQSVFYARLLSVSNSGNMINLLSKPITVGAHNTYTIDPIIRPDMPIACPGCGGGTGGSGGTPSAPSVSDFTISQKSIQIGSNEVLSAYVNYGNVNTRVDFLAQTVYQNWFSVANVYVLYTGYVEAQFVVNNFTYQAVKVVVTNQYGSKTSSVIGMSVVNAMSDIYIFNTAGSNIAMYTLSVKGLAQNHYDYSTLIFENGNKFSYPVNKVSEKLTNDFGKDKDASYGGVDWGKIHPYIQNQANNSFINNSIMYTVLADIVWNAANVYFYGVLPNPLAFASSPNVHLIDNSNPYTYKLSAGYINPYTKNSTYPNASWYYLGITQGWYGSYPLDYPYARGFGLGEFHLTSNGFTNNYVSYNVSLSLVSHSGQSLYEASGNTLVTFGIPGSLS